MNGDRLFHVRTYMLPNDVFLGSDCAVRRIAEFCLVNTRDRGQIIYSMAAAFIMFRFGFKPRSQQQ